MNPRPIKELIWSDNPPKRATDIYEVVSRADVPMPHTVGNACIEITFCRYENGYEATLWCFNRGTPLTGASYCKTINEAKDKSIKWWDSFVNGFLNQS